jgi:hypothetical protein
MSEGNTNSREGDRFGRRDVVVHRTAHDGHGSISVSVVEALAEANGVSPVDIRQPLYDVVDPDALDSLFTDNEGPGRVIFELAGHEITVHASGEILVRDRSEY